MITRTTVTSRGSTRACSTCSRRRRSGRSATIRTRLATWRWRAVRAARRARCAGNAIQAAQFQQAQAERSEKVAAEAEEELRKLHPGLAADFADGFAEWLVERAPAMQQTPMGSGEFVRHVDTELRVWRDVRGRHQRETRQAEQDRTWSRIKGASSRFSTDYDRPGLSGAGRVARAVDGASSGAASRTGRRRKLVRPDERALGHALDCHSQAAELRGNESSPRAAASSPRP